MGEWWDIRVIQIRMDYQNQRVTPIRSLNSGHLLRYDMCIVDMDWKIGIYRRYFFEISDIGRPFAPIIDSPGISSKNGQYRRSTDKSKINREWS